MRALRERRKVENAPDGLRKLVRETREQRGLTQQELADNAGVSRTTIALFEVGQRDMTLELFGRVARVLDLALLVESEPKVA